MSYYVFWYSIDSKLTVPREMVENLRDVDPRAKVPKKTLDNGHLSNINVRAALRGCVEDTLGGLKLAPSTYFLDVSTSRLTDLDYVLFDIGCTTGSVQVSPSDPVTSITIKNGVNHKLRELESEICTLYGKYQKRRTAFNYLKVQSADAQKDALIKRYEILLGPLYHAPIGDYQKISPELDKLKELYDS